MATIGLPGPPASQAEQLSSSIRLHSPLAVTGAYIYMLRDYYGQERLPWIWRNNKTTTDILIESGMEPAVNVTNPKPAILVSKGQTAYGKIVIGDRDQNQPRILEHRLEHFYSNAEIDLIVNCLSPRRGESMYIADVTQHYLHASQRLIMAGFGIRDISPVVMNTTDKYELDEAMWTTPIIFRINVELRWATVPVAPALRRLHTFIADSGESGDPLVEMVLSGTG